LIVERIFDRTLPIRRLRVRAAAIAACDLGLPATPGERPLLAIDGIGPWQP
jgi:hypothetical protein